MNNEDRKLKTQVQMMESLKTIILNIPEGNRSGGLCKAVSDDNFCRGVECDACPFYNTKSIQIIQDAFENLI